jgi:hypothetical protein
VALRTLEDNRLQLDSNAGGWLHVRATANQTRRNLCTAHISVTNESLCDTLDIGRDVDPAPAEGAALKNSL